MNTLKNRVLLFSDVKQIVLSIFVCYLPHVFSAPFWVSLLAFIMASYCLYANRCPNEKLTKLIRIFFIFSVLVLLVLSFSKKNVNYFFITAVVSLTWLKLLETKKMQDLKMLSIFNFFIIFTALLNYQRLWILLYLVVAVCVNFILLYKAYAPNASFYQLRRSSVKLLTIVFPISVLLFFIFPRAGSPLWSFFPPSEGKTGFSESLSAGSIESLFFDDSTAMKIMFANKPRFNAYWRGLVLSRYDGKEWTRLRYRKKARHEYLTKLSYLPASKKSDYTVMLYPHHKKWLFYEKSVIASRPVLRFDADIGLLNRDGQVITQRFLYAVKERNYPRRSSGYLKTRGRINNNYFTRLPENTNPKLQRWAKEKFSSVNGQLVPFIALIKNHIRNNNYWYRLMPQSIGQDKNKMDRFWFDTQEGYCSYYASATTIIFRAAGIPANVIVGYHGGKWNPYAKFLEIKQSDAHAWVEYWNGVNWVSVDPTQFIAPSRIDKTIYDRRQPATLVGWNSYQASLGWFDKMKLSLASVKFKLERLFIFYNSDSQKTLFKRFGFDDINWRTLLKLFMGVLLSSFFIMGLFYYVKFKPKYNSLQKAYKKLQKTLIQQGVKTCPPYSFCQQLRALSDNKPMLKAYLQKKIDEYSKLRLQSTFADCKKNRLKTRLLFNEIRAKLKKN